MLRLSENTPRSLENLYIEQVQDKDLAIVGSAVWDMLLHRKARFPSLQSIEICFWTFESQSAMTWPLDDAFAYAERMAVAEGVKFRYSRKIVIPDFYPPYFPRRDKVLWVSHSTNYRLN